MNPWRGRNWKRLLLKCRKLVSNPNLPLIVAGQIVVVEHALYISVYVHHFIASFAQNPVKTVTPVSKLRQSLARNSAKLVEKLMGNSGSSSTRQDASPASDSSKRWDNLSRFVGYTLASKSSRSNKVACFLSWNRCLLMLLCGQLLILQPITDCLEVSFFIWRLLCPITCKERLLLLF